MQRPPHIAVRDLSVAYGDFEVLRQVSFDVQRGEVVVIMGPSGSGKSTLLHAMVGLTPVLRGEVRYDGESFLAADRDEQRRLSRRFGVLFQSGALWSNLTLAENVALPLEELTRLPRAQIRRVVELKLALVGLRGFESFYPSQLSGGMQKRAALARAMALDPEILFFDEPTSGLDPIGARRMDELILELQRGLGTTLVVVSHDLATIHRIATTALYLDPEAKTVVARGAPNDLARGGERRAREFLGGRMEERP